MSVSEQTRPAGAGTERECDRCGSLAAPGQEYCLECGARLPLGPAPPGIARGSAPWLWPVLVAGVVAILATAAVVAYQLAQRETPRPLLVATTDVGTLTPTEEAPDEPVATTAPAPPPPPPAAQTGPAQAPPNRLIAWPAGKNGFTIVVASLPEEAGRAAATAKAREAMGVGVRQVGILRSARFPSLHPGYFVVFTGVYDSRGEAEAALAGVKRAGYPAAYARPVSS